MMESALKILLLLVCHNAILVAQDMTLPVDTVADANDISVLSDSHDIPVVEPNAVFSDGIFVFSGSWQFQGPVYLGQPDKKTVVYFLSGNYEMLSKSVCFHVTGDTQVYIIGTPEVYACFYPLYEVADRMTDVWWGFWVRQGADNVIMDVQFSSFWFTDVPFYTESRCNLVIRDCIFDEQFLGIYAMYPQFVFEENICFLNSKDRDDYVSIYKYIEHSGAPQDPNCHECDLNFDGANDANDLEILQSWWLQDEPNSTMYPDFCAIDDDPIVDQNEMDVLMHCWGKTPGPDLFYGDSKFIKRFTSSLGWWHYIDLGDYPIKQWSSYIATEIAGVPEVSVPSGMTDPNWLGQVVLAGNCWDRNVFANLAVSGVFAIDFRDSVYGRAIVNWPVHIAKSDGNPISPVNCFEPEEYCFYDQDEIIDNGLLLLDPLASCIDHIPEASVDSDNYWAASVRAIYPEWPDKGNLNPGYHFKGIREACDRNTGHNPPGDFTHDGVVGLDDLSIFSDAWLSNPVWLWDNIPQFEDPNDLARYIADLPDPNCLMDWQDSIVDLPDFAALALFFESNFPYETADEHIYVNIPPVSIGTIPARWWFLGDHRKSVDCVHLYIDGDFKGIFGLKDIYRWFSNETWNGQHAIKVIVTQLGMPYYSKMFTTIADNEISLVKIDSNGTTLFISGKGQPGANYDVSLTQTGLDLQEGFTEDMILQYPAGIFDEDKEVTLQISRYGQIVMEYVFKVADVRIQTKYN
jgi:hypothetical protein